MLFVFLKRVFLIAGTGTVAYAGVLTGRVLCGAAL
jgi:hypothetical protein